MAKTPSRQSVQHVLDPPVLRKAPLPYTAVLPGSFRNRGHQWRRRQV